MKLDIIEIKAQLETLSQNRTIANLVHREAIVQMTKDFVSDGYFNEYDTKKTEIIVSRLIDGPILTRYQDYLACGYAGVMMNMREEKIV